MKFSCRHPTVHMLTIISSDLENSLGFKVPASIFAPTHFVAVAVRLRGPIFGVKKHV